MKGVEGLTSVCVPVLTVKADGVYDHVSLLIDSGDLAQDERRARVRLTISEEIHGLHAGVAERQLQHGSRCNHYRQDRQK